MCGNFDGDGYEINLVITDHREGIGKPTISAEGFSRFPRPLLATRCNSRELHAGKTADCRNVRSLFLRRGWRQLQQRYYFAASLVDS